MMSTRTGCRPVKILARVGEQTGQAAKTGYPFHPGHLGPEYQHGVKSDVQLAIMDHVQETCCLIFGHAPGRKIDPVEIIKDDGQIVLLNHGLVP